MLHAMIKSDRVPTQQNLWNDWATTSLLTHDPLHDLAALESADAVTFPNAVSEYPDMINLRKLYFIQLVVAASALAGCGSSDSGMSAADAATAAAATGHAHATTPVQEAAATTPAETVSRERVLRAMKCQIVLSQNASVAMMNNADTGLPADLAARLKVSAIARWEKFAAANAEAAGVHDSDRAQLVTQLDKLSSTAEDRQHTVEIVRDCLDNDV